MLARHDVVLTGGAVGIGRWRKIEIETLCVASQATVGGPSTALALAISKRWSALVTPSVLLGVLGYPRATT
jgi:uncharacterized membrane protein